MSRIADTFASLKAANRTALVPFITTGDPSLSASVPLMHALVAAGADMLELSIPFSDPMADGPVIQRASERALARGVYTEDVLSVLRTFRETDDKTPVVLMGYLNPVEVMGYQKFASAAAESGADGCIVVDLPPEEGADLDQQLRAHDIDPVFLLAPTTTAERMDTICAAASGFVYYVSLRGVTGAANLDLSEVRARLEEVRKHTKLPVGVGFGINSPESAAKVAEFADAVIVGSAVMQIIERNQDNEAQAIKDAGAFVAELRQALDGAALKLASGT
jgi:tryptophan synthase alpha chain